MRRGCAKWTAAGIGLIVMGLLGARCPGGVVVVEDSIQAAVDAAAPGTVIVVPPGVYREAVLVDKDDITIVGSRSAVIDAAGFDYGIRVGTGEITRYGGGDPVCPPLEVRGFTLAGLTIRDSEDDGIFLIGAQNYIITGGRYVDNFEYGIFPICSRNGAITFNEVEGTIDAGIYVGDDHGAVVRHNRVTRCTIGVEVENSENVRVIGNYLSGNTAGILAVVLPDLPLPFTRNVRIERNVVVGNNMPNPVPLDSGDAIALLPAGTGILNVGGDDLLIRHNAIHGNDTAGLGLLDNPFAAADDRIDAPVDGNQVRENLILGNGDDPDTSRPIAPGVDVFVEISGEGNCFEDNVFQTESPEGVTESLGPCPPESDRSPSPSNPISLVPPELLRFVLP